MADFPSSAIVWATARDIISPSLIYPNYVTPPILTYSDSRPFLSFMIGKGEAIDAESGYVIWPPGLLAFFEVTDGHFAELRTVEPQDFQQRDNPNEALSKGLSPLEKTEPDFLQKQISLCLACDKLIEVLYAHQNHQPALEAYDAIMAQTLEKALFPYYRNLVMNTLVPASY